MVRPARGAAIVLALAVCQSALPASEPATRPLHSRIDELVEAAAVGPLAPICSDTDFVRRIYLDLTGIIPTADEARAFVDDQSADKRQRLIDTLIAGPGFTRHMTTTLDVMLMERKPDKNVKQVEWDAFLFNSLAANKPLDQLYRELVASSGENATDQLRPAAKFLLDRDAEPNLVTRDIGRLVFGMDLQCCQCHDHPLINDYYQDDYYGLFAFVHRTGLFTDAKTKLVSLTEKADGEASFKSVFTGASSDKALPRLPKGAVLFIEPTYAKGQEYSVAPTKDVRGVPKFSRRAALAEMLPTSREFSRNLANRLWAVMFGRGIVHPLDFHYSANPPSNPQLLSLLSDNLSAGSFQLRPFIRELVLTRAYQRSCDPPRPDTLNFSDIASRLAQLKRDKANQEKALPPLKETLAAAKSTFQSLRDEDARVAAEISKHEKSVADARQALEKLASERQAREATAKTVLKQAQVLAAAVVRLRAAAKSLPSDMALQDVANNIQAHSQALTVAAETAQKSASEPSSPAADAAQTLATAESALEAVLAKRGAPDKLRELEKNQLTAQQKLSEALFAVAAYDLQIATAQSLLDYADLAKSDPPKAEAAWTAIIEKLTIANQVAPLKALSAEQFAVSAMQATGMYSPLIGTAQGKINKAQPDVLKNAQGEEKTRLLTNLTQLELLNVLRGTFTEFVRQYGTLPGEEFQATVNQALFFGNGSVIDGWLKPAGQNLIANLAKIDNADAIVDNLYWTVHSRSPTEAERRVARDYLLKGTGDKASADKPTILGELAWALLSSNEFRFNH